MRNDRIQGEKRFRTLLRALREECPTTMGFPVYVRRREPAHRWYGWTNLRDDQESFLIVLSKNVIDKVTRRARRATHGEIQETLIHEWAHAMAWTPDHHSLTFHDAAWGVAYSRAYQAVVED